MKDSSLTWYATGKFHAHRVTKGSYENEPAQITLKLKYLKQKQNVPFLYLPMKWMAAHRFKWSTLFSTKKKTPTFSTKHWLSFDKMLTLFFFFFVNEFPTKFPGGVKYYCHAGSVLQLEHFVIPREKSWSITMQVMGDNQVLWQHLQFQTAKL